VERDELFKVIDLTVLLDPMSNTDPVKVANKNTRTLDGCSSTMCRAQYSVEADSSMPLRKLSSTEKFKHMINRVVLSNDGSVVVHITLSICAAVSGASSPNAVDQILETVDVVAAICLTGGNR
jgi:hypothetical protein